MTVGTHYEDKVLAEVIEHRYGPASVDIDQDQIDRIVQLRAMARLHARQIAAVCPPSWERDEALKAVDEANSWAAKAIARNE